MKKVSTHRGRHAVFVDPTGRRRRLVLGAGIAAGCLLTAYLVIVAIGLVTGSGAPLTPWPEGKPSHREAAPNGENPSLRSESSPSVSKRPTVSASPSGTVPTARSAPATTHAATTAPTTRPGHGHGYGLSRAPHPKKT